MVTDTPVRQKAEEAGNEDGDDPKLAVLSRETTVLDGGLADQSGDGEGVDDPLQWTPEHVREGVIKRYRSRPGHHERYDIANTVTSVINPVVTDRPRSAS